MKIISILQLLLAVLLLGSCAEKSIKTTEVEKEKFIWEDLIHEGNEILDNEYEKFEYEIPMRDGNSLFTIVYIPKDKSQEYPIMLCRTPYSAVAAGGNYSYKLYKFGLSKSFIEEKFIFAYQDVRGRFKSGGEYINMTPHIKNKTSNSQVDESTDTYDAVEWMINNIPNNNGNVGMWGISYPGFYAAAGSIEAHPALKAVSPQAPIADWFWDDFHHNGAFFMASSFSFFKIFGVPRTEKSSNWPAPIFNIEPQNKYNFFLKEIGALSNITKNYYKGKIPFWNEMENHPDYDKFWQARNILPHLRNIKPAIMTVGGLFDAEDLYGTFKVYKEIEENDKDANNMLVIGPWYHGGWSRSDGTFLGDVSFGNDILPSEYYQQNIELPFFNYHLKGKENPNLAEAYVFETGTNKWREFDTWPPENVEYKELHFTSENKIVFAKPENGNAEFDEFISDPANPVPFTSDTTWDITREYMIEDQSFVANREDVLVYETEVLTEDITLAGNIIADLKVSTSGTDADWIVKIIDVYPNTEGLVDEAKDKYAGKQYQQMVRSEVFRGRYRNSFEKPEPFIPNEVATVEIELLDVLHTFKKGHKIMIQVQSSWFPLVDRNPQKYIDNIYKAIDEDYIVATHRLYHSKDHSSKLKVRVLKD